MDCDTDKAKCPRPEREVAAELGISRRQLRKIEKSAFDKMRAAFEEEAHQADRAVLGWVFEQEESSMSREPRYALGEEVLIHRLRDHPLKGVVTSARPLKAKVTDPDPVFRGAETTDGIRKINPKTINVGRRK